MTVTVVFVQFWACLILIDKIVSTEDKPLLKDYKAWKEWPTKREPADPANLRIFILDLLVESLKRIINKGPK